MKLGTQIVPPAGTDRDAIAGGDANEYTKNQRSAVSSLTDAANVSIEASASNIFELVATPGVGATRQLDNPTGLVKGMTFQVWFQQDGTGGRALTFGGFYDFGDEGDPDFTGSGANEIDFIVCLVTSATTIAATVGSGAPPQPHALGGSEHTADTLANLNAKVSDATLIDTADSRLSDARTPTSHSLGGSEHAADTFDELNSKVSDETLAGLGTQQAFTKNQRSAISTLTDAVTVAVDASLSNVFELTATGGVGATRALGNPTNVTAGMTWIIIYNQDGTGSRALTFSGNYDFGDETAPDLSSDAANETTIISCVALTATQIACSALLGFA